MITKVAYKKGMIIIQTIVFGAIAVLMISALATATASSVQIGRITYNREQAFQSAEAGIEYYRWHLAHSATDYQDGTGAPGPYIHTLYDKDGNAIGQFALSITQPSMGYTLVKITSDGSSTLDPAYNRVISSQVAKPSIAEYAFAGNAAMRFGEGTEVYGKIHSNGGIRFDGLAHNIVTSSATTYDDADHSGNNEIGVHTHVNPQPGSGVTSSYRAAEADPNSIPVRTDVFQAGRKISQPVVDFTGFTTDIAALKANAVANGFYRDAAGGSYVGYHLVLKTNDTFDLYKINSWTSVGNCNGNGSATTSWSINSQTLQGNYAFPANGILFFEDTLVIDGQINGARLTITAADLPVPTDTTKYKNIIINNDLSYTNQDGTDSIGLVAQGGIKVGMISEDNLKIDGALIAQNDDVGRFYYSGNNCNYKNRSTLSLYGMIGSHDRYGFAYTDGTGYATRNITYDTNLLYAPPPDFPLTGSQYQILSWQENAN
jgi:hypothetical protein